MEVPELIEPLLKSQNFKESFASVMNIQSEEGRSILWDIYKQKSSKDWRKMVMLYQPFFEKYIPKSFLDGLGCAQFLEELDEISLEDQKNLVDIMSTYLGMIDLAHSGTAVDANKFLSILKIVRTLKHMSLHERELLYARFIPLLDKIHDPDMHYRILLLIKGVPEKFQKKLIDSIFPIIHSEKIDAEMKPDIIYLFSETPPKVFQNYAWDTSCFITFFQGLKGNRNKTIFNALWALPPQERFSYLGIILPLILKVNNWAIREKIIKIYHPFKPEDITRLMNDTDMHYKILPTAKGISVEDQNVFINAVSPIIQNLVVEDRIKQDIIYLFEDTPPEKFRIFYENTQNFVKFFQSLPKNKVTTIFGDLRDIPPRERIFFLGRILPSILLIPNWNIRAEIIRAHIRYSYTDIAALINHTTLPLFMKLLDRAEDILEVLSYCINIHESLVRKVLPFIENIPGGNERAQIIDFFKTFDDEDCIEFSKIIFPFMEHYSPNGFINKERNKNKTLRRLKKEKQNFFQDDFKDDIEYYIRVEMFHEFKEIFQRDKVALEEIVGLIYPHIEEISITELETENYQLLLKIIVKMKSDALNSQERKELFEGKLSKIREKHNDHRESCMERMLLKLG